jgi:hypothetical protein
MGWPRRESEEQGVFEELLNISNARNRKIVKILTLKCLGGDHDKLKWVFSTASLDIRGHIVIKLSVILNSYHPKSLPPHQGLQFLLAHGVVPFKDRHCLVAARRHNSNLIEPMGYLL